MQRKIRTRTLVILLITLGSVAIIFRPHHKPTIRDFTSWTQIKQNVAENIHLGLDLKGGSHLVMQVQNSRGGPQAFNYKPLVLTMKLADTESVSGSANGELGPTLQAHPNSP